MFCSLTHLLHNLPTTIANFTHKLNQLTLKKVGHYFVDTTVNQQLLTLKRSVCQNKQQIVKIMKDKKK